ncbi:hypothetical protein LTR10_016034 [Elasticomyces elasticus]|nr:hypothetical protein LTR10_016034 [Elasticomyces elasticus]KAK5030722.1 hypothetical protein LTR13_008076 [Exophiala sideris]KAK5179664.1 hypothetical protein LTR44_007832 [Eurotiomycetes sp. CCFEE 6388]
MADTALDDLELFELAPDALDAIADVATLIGVEKLDRNFGILGGELAALSEYLESSSGLTWDKRSRRKIRKLLRDLERVCTWHQNDRIQEFTFLTHLSQASHLQPRSKDTVEQGLLAYADEGGLADLIRLVKDFAGRFIKTMPGQTFINVAVTSNVVPHVEYPSRVSQQLYQTLLKHSRCECAAEIDHTASPVERKTHFSSRLGLKPSREVKDERICFDTAFSPITLPSSILSRVEWQYVQFQVPRETLGTKRARFSNKALDSVDQQTGPYVETRLCDQVKSASGSIICLRVHEGRLLLENCLPPAAQVLAAQSLSLSDALRTRHLSNRMKVILAYIIARSVWEFYDSDWMSKPWTAQDIHFMQETLDGECDEPLLFVNRPFLSVQWNDIKDDASESSSRAGLIHRYPRILELGLMMIEIGSGRRAADHFPSSEANINSDWLFARGFLSKVTPWDDFEYNRYWDAARSCVNSQVFFQATPRGNQGRVSHDIEGRRRMILEEVVLPLENLLTGTGWADDLERVGPMKSLSLGPTQSRRIQLLMVQALWLQKLENYQILLLSLFPLEAALEGLPIPANATPIRPPSSLGFEVAIICALETEANAVISSLGTVWENDVDGYDQALGDSIAYTIGRIEKHNVVVVHMPSTGKVSAASVARGLRSTFQRIRLALVVGICGGVPHNPHTKRDIFLGDVVISRSLIQYDYGRQYLTRFEPKGSNEGGLGKLPIEIQSILAKLNTDHHRPRLEARANNFLSDLQQEYAEATYPGADTDRSFASSTLHVHRKAGVCHVCSWETDPQFCLDAMKSTCEDLGCEQGGSVRHRGSSENHEVSKQFPPSIYIGRMCSSDTVMKSAKDRDDIAREHDVIAFEMEGAGVWDSIASLVIKGVCDYADSHKKKNWQKYAAFTAAAAAKAFLGEWKSQSQYVAT